MRVNLQYLAAEKGAGNTLPSLTTTACQ